MTVALLAVGLTTSGCASGTSPPGLSPSSGQWLFVATNNPDPHIYARGSVLAFAPPFPYGPPATITKGIDHPGSIATNAMGDLFVDNWNTHSITIFSEPYDGQPRVLAGAFPFSQLALDHSGNLFVLTNAGNPPSSLVELKPPYDKVLVRIPKVYYALSFTLDSRDDVLMNFYGPSSNRSMIRQYLAPTYTKIGATLKFTESIAATGVNANDRLFVLLFPFGSAESSVAIYAVKQKTIVLLHKPFHVGCGASMAVPAHGDVFVANICSTGIYEISSPAFNHATLLSGLKHYGGLLAVDGAGNLYIVGTDVLISAPPYSGVTYRTPVNYHGRSVTDLTLGPAQF